MNFSLDYGGRLLLFFVALAATGTTMVGSGSSTNQAWADVFEGTEGPDEIIGTPLDDLIDSKGGNDFNFGDALEGDGFGDDVIVSGEESDLNNGDTNDGDGFGDDVIVSGDEDDNNKGDTNRGDGFVDDVIISGDGGDGNSGDTTIGTGFEDDVIVSGDGDDQSTGNGGADIFVCGDGEDDTVTDFNEAEGDIATPDCENI
jgi:Ca2+-binding RTX toxin-like protein